MTYLRNRVLRLIPVFFLVTFASFTLLNILPGDVVDAILQDPEAAVDDTSEMRQVLIEELGLDRPLVVRYFAWLGDMARGDFGVSYITEIPVWEQIAQRLPVTVELLVIAQTLALLIAIPLGVWAAYRVNRGVDRALSVIVFGIVAAPGALCGSGASRSSTGRSIRARRAGAVCIRAA